ncbi:hypothetical protein GCM10020260_17420 [Nesterenkonia halobia]|uniref:Mutator family transposase n=1 Tax=Nesterenkonia halobia TaxID=37922 RepID=A0ABP6RCV6_9MICC
MDSSGIENLSESRINQMAGELDEQAAAFRARPLDTGPCTFVAADAPVLTVREAGRVVPVHALVATGINSDGRCDILGLQVTSNEDGAGCGEPSATSSPADSPESSWSLPALTPD